MSHATTTETTAESMAAGAAPATKTLHAHPQVQVPKIAIIHIVIGLVITYAGLFTMMTVLFAAYGAWLATIGPMYVALMLPLSLRNADVR